MAFCVQLQGDRQGEGGGAVVGTAGWVAVLDAEKHCSPTKISPREPLAVAKASGGGGASMQRLGASDAAASDSRPMASPYEPPPTSRPPQRSQPP